MASVVFSGTDGVEFFVVETDEFVAALRVFENPITKRLLDALLLLLCQSGFFLVQVTFAVVVLIVDSRIPAVQSVLYDVVGAGPVCPIGGVCLDVTAVTGFIVDSPLGGVRRVVNLGFLSYPLHMRRSPGTFALIL